MSGDTIKWYVLPLRFSVGDKVSDPKEHSRTMMGSSLASDGSFAAASLKVSYREQRQRHIITRIVTTYRHKLILHDS
jgi:hypothetical protein